MLGLSHAGVPRLAGPFWSIRPSWRACTMVGRTQTSQESPSLPGTQRHP